MTSFRYLSCAIVFLTVGLAIVLKLNSQESPPGPSYVGVESCLTAGCHAGAYGEESTYQGSGPFRETMHQRVHLRPSPETVVIDRLFDNDTILKSYDPLIPVQGKDTLLIYLSKSADGRDYFIQLKFSGGGDTTPKMKVAYTYGGNGWIQRYLVAIDSSYYVAPFQYILPGYRKRIAHGGSFFFLDRARWYTIDSNTFEGKFFKWSSTTFRSKSWDKACAQCHVNGFDVEKRIDGSDTTWRALWVGSRGDSATRDQNINVGCESCHGPGSEHAANPTAQNIISPREFGNTPSGIDLKLDLCNQCHTRFVSSGGSYPYAYDEKNNVPYVPGRPLKDFMRDPFKDAQMWADGLTSYAHHQTGQDYARSKVYAAHIFQNGCWSCHLAHTPGKNGLPYQLDRNWYSMTKGEGCLAFGCHEGMADTALNAEMGRVVNLHTQHSQRSSQCVNCHFTKTATIAFDELPGKPLREFSFHGFKVLRPILTREFSTRAIMGMLNSCAEGCHRNGRGSRNFDAGDPEAPSFGIVDRNAGSWRERSDIDLADSLWYHYRKMYARYVNAVKEDGAEGRRIEIAASPNPFKSVTRIEFSVPRSGDMELAMHDMKGRLVRVLAAGRHEAGRYAVTWDGLDELGRESESGAYIVRMTTGRESTSEKVVLQR